MGGEELNILKGVFSMYSLVDLRIYITLLYQETYFFAYL